MADKLSVQALLASWLPQRYLARYEQNLAADLNALGHAAEAETRPLDQFYIVLRLQQRRCQHLAARETQSAKPIDIWDALFHAPRLVIVGEAGAGKTTTLKYVAVELALHAMPESYVRRLTFLHQGRALDHLLPVYVDLRLSELQGDDLVYCLASVLENYAFPSSTAYLRGRMEEGSCLLLLDHSDALETPERLVHLQQLLDRYPRVPVVLAARTPPADGLSPEWLYFEPLPLSDRDIATFIRHRLGDKPPEAALLQALERDPGLASLASNPFLLSILTSSGETATQAPLRLAHLYRQCLRALCGELTDSRRFVGALQKLASHFTEQGQLRFEAQELREVWQREQGSAGRSDVDDIPFVRLMDSGLLHRLNGVYAFLRPALQAFLTAGAIVSSNRMAETVSAHGNDESWHEIIVLATALRGVASEVVPQILTSVGQSPYGLDLAARCAAEAAAVPGDLKQDLRARLFAAFECGDSEACQAAAVRIAALDGQSTRHYFPWLLREGALDERRRAALVMGRIGAPEWASAPLMSALETTRPAEVRCMAAGALGQLQDRRAIQALVQTLKDDNEEVATAAASALGAIGRPAVPALISTLGSDHPTARRMAVLALGQMGPSAREPLICIIQDDSSSDGKVRGAAEALGLFGDAAAVPQLMRLLRSREGRLADSAARALTAIGEPAVQALVDALPTRRAELELRKAIVNALVTIGEPAINPLIRSLDHHSAAVRGAAEEALTRIGPPAMEALIVALRTEDWDLRRRIAQILGQIGHESLAEPLVPVLKDTDPGVRARAAEILGRLRQELAVEPLVQVAQEDGDEYVRRAAIRALAELGSERAIAPLIELLSDAQQRDISAVALGEIGKTAVEPLIQAVYEHGDPACQEAAVRALKTIGTRQFGLSDLTGVAQVYAQLHEERPSTPDMIALLGQVGWWKPAQELLAAFSTAQSLSEAETVEEVADCSERLTWVGTLKSPVRAPMASILWNLNNVAQNVRLYLHASNREGQRDAMLSAINTMTEIQQTINNRLLPFERTSFATVVDVWRTLIEGAIKELRGRAELEIVPLRADLPIESTSSAAMIVFRLTNVGDSAARNLSVTLRPSVEDGFELVGAPVQQLDPLGPGMQRDVGFWIKPRSVPEASYAFEVSYDDDDRSGHFFPTSGRIRFLVVEEQYRPIPASPYVMGPPVKTERMFYGRQEVFDWIRENISGADQQNILILQGERRMGKTSILYQLINHPPSPQHTCIFYSLELTIINSLADVLYDLAMKICEGMTACGLQVPAPVQAEFNQDAQRSLQSFLDRAEDALGERRLLIMIDEIDILISKVEQRVLSDDVFHLLRGLWQHRDKIAFIVTGAYKVREMLSDNRSILFHVAKSYTISYLDRGDAEALIVEPVAEHLTYDNMVVDKIIRFTACHPYFIQYICDELVKLAQRMRKNWVYLPDIDVVLQGVIQDDNAVLRNTIYDPLTPAERRVLAALASVTDDRRILVPADSVVQSLDRLDLSVSGKELLNALYALCERDLVIERRMGQTLQYGFKMDLIRMWLQQNDMLLRLSQEARI
jgi:HEAT repeat protein/Cdc6-like AAA superfamily ATPase